MASSWSSSATGSCVWAWSTGKRHWPARVDRSWWWIPKRGPTIWSAIWVGRSIHCVPRFSERDPSRRVPRRRSQRSHEQACRGFTYQSHWGAGGRPEAVAQELGGAPPDGWSGVFPGICGLGVHSKKLKRFFFPAVWLDLPRVPYPPGPRSKKRSLPSAEGGPISWRKLRSRIRKSGDGDLQAPKEKLAGARCAGEKAAASHPARRNVHALQGEEEA